MFWWYPRWQPFRATDCVEQFHLSDHGYRGWCLPSIAFPLSPDHLQARSLLIPPHCFNYILQGKQWNPYTVLCLHRPDILFPTAARSVYSGKKNFYGLKPVGTTYWDCSLSLYWASRFPVCTFRFCLGLKPVNIWISGQSCLRETQYKHHYKGYGNNNFNP